MRYHRPGALPSPPAARAVRPYLRGPGSRALAALAWCAWLGCTPGDGPRFRHDTVEILPAPRGLPLSRRMIAVLDRPGRLEIAVRDARGERTLTLPAARRHEVPLVGFLPEDRVEITVTASDDRGSAVVGPLGFRTGKLPERFPEIEVLASVPERSEPGYTLFPIELVSDDSLLYLVALDDRHEVVWLWEAPLEFGDLRTSGEGTLLALGAGSAWELSLSGEVLRQWGEDRRRQPRPDRYVHVDAPGMNHELFPVEGGFLTLSPRRFPVPHYPCDYDHPDSLCGPATLEDPHLVEFDADGLVLRDWSMASRLDPFRIGFDSLDRLPDGSLDWAHGNAAIPTPDGGFLVSLRHQDALIALDRRGEVSWILGDPAGWPERLADKLLSPVGEPFSWPYHPHGPSFDAEGTLWMFDNRNPGRTPYDPELGEPAVSRVVGYRVDPDARTVSQVAERRQTATGEVYSRALGNAAVLPSTGNVFADYGMVTDHDGVDNTALGFGSRCARLVEWAPDGQVVGDVRIRSDYGDEPLGWRVYRAVRVGSLYAPGVESAISP